MHTTPQPQGSQSYPSQPHPNQPHTRPSHPPSFGPPPFTRPPAQPPARHGPRLRPVAGLGTGAIALVVAALAAGLLRLAATFWTTQVLFGPQDEGVLALGERLHGPLVLVTTAVILLVPTAIAAGVITLLWVHHARTNAGLLSPHLRLRYTPTASVLLLLVPVANAYFIGPVLGDIGAASVPYGRDERGPGLVRAFWLTAIVTAAVAGIGNLVLSVVSQQLLATGALGEATANHVATAALAFQTVTHLLAIACAVLFARVVRHISRLQTALVTGR